MTTYNVTKPLPSESPSFGDNEIRTAKLALQERLNVDHNFTLVGSATVAAAGTADIGKHRQIVLYESITSVAAAALMDAGDSILYPQTADGVLELFFQQQSDATEHQLTVYGGHLNCGNDNVSIELHTDGALRLKDGGTTWEKLNATANEFCDDDTLEINDPNGLQIKAPADCYSPVERSGEYMGTGALQTITVGFSIKRLVIKCTAHASSGAHERESGGIYGSAAFKAWKSDGTVTTDIALSGTDFTVTGTSDKINKLNNTFYWWASGERA